MSWGVNNCLSKVTQTEQHIWIPLLITEDITTKLLLTTSEPLLPHPDTHMCWSVTQCSIWDSIEVNEVTLSLYSVGIFSGTPDSDCDNNIAMQPVTSALRKTWILIKYKNFVHNCNQNLFMHFVLYFTFYIKFTIKMVI